MKGLKAFASILCVVFSFCIGLSGCAEDVSISQKETSEEAVEKIVQRFYNCKVEGNFDEATSLLIFSEETADERELYPGAFSSTPTQSYTIDAIEELAPKVYEAHVIGTYLAPFQVVYGEDGEATGISGDGMNRWYLNVFSQNVYIVKQNGKWGICPAARNVPKGMYEFPPEELEEPGVLTSLDDK